MNEKHDADFRANLADSQVVTESGKELGTFVDVTFDTTHGGMKTVLVDPVENLRSSFNYTNAGLLKVPSRNVKAVENCLVVSE